MALRGGATAVKSSSEKVFLEEVLTEAPTRQLGSQKQRLVLPPCMLVKVAVLW